MARADPVFRNISVSNLRVKQSGANASVWGKDDGAAITIVGLDSDSITGLSLIDVTVDRYTTPAIQCSQAQVSIRSVAPHLTANNSAGCIVHDA
eukprot:SAG31_NODE_11310_length_1043_cov_1.131356_1_plen_94_part_00